MFFKSITILALPLFASAAKLSIKLQPAVATNEKSEETGILYFQVVAPEPYSSSLDGGSVVCSDDSESVCSSGSFTTDLSQFNKIEVSFAASEGEAEIFLRGVAQDKEDSELIIAEFLATSVANCTEDYTILILDKSVKVAKVDVYGSQAGDLEHNFIQQISPCSIYTRLSFGAPTSDSSFSEIVFTMPLNIQNTTTQVYSYDSNKTSWIAAAGLVASEEEVAPVAAWSPTAAPATNAPATAAPVAASASDAKISTRTMAFLVAMAIASCVLLATYEFCFFLSI